jgi:pyrroline-5-carboxylate reductase
MNLLLVGCGNIGSALLKLWVSNKSFDTIVVVQPSMSLATYFADSATVRFVKEFKFIPVDFIPDLLVLAIKPQMFSALLPDISKQVQNSIVVSLLSGISIKSLQNAVKTSTKIVRLMPNVAIKTGLSVNLTYTSQNFMSADVSAIEKAFAVSGKIVWLQQEELLDILTPISGSGPAYFFLLAEILSQAAHRAGIDDILARELAQQVLIGSASLVATSTDFETLIDSVTSKGGITEAALKVMTPGFNLVFDESLKKALLRLRELEHEDRN